MQKFKTNGNKDISTNNIEAKLGLSDKNNHSTFYIEGKTFVKPFSETGNYAETIEELKAVCDKSIKSHLNKNNNFSSNFLTHYDLCSERMDINKKSYMSFQIYIKQNQENIMGILDVKEKNNDFFKDILSSIEEDFENYGFHLYKSKN